MMIQILTLQLDPSSQAHFEALRRRYFPEPLNLIPAHLTLFHNLPETTQILADLYQEVQALPAFEVQVTGIRSLGRGVAYTIASSVLIDLHRRLANAFKEHLIPQDRQRFMPHIVVQNKVTQAQAKELSTRLTHEFAPMTAWAIGVNRWEYLGGPWRHLESIAMTDV